MSDVTNEDAKADSITEGCYSVIEGALTKEVCVCTGYDYCNSSSQILPNIILIFVFFFYFIQ